MKIKIPILVTTTIKHTDNPLVNCPQIVAVKHVHAEIEVEADDEAAKVFRAIWVKNELEVTVSGSKTFSDGVEIA
jgi:hypothetical protein